MIMCITHNKRTVTSEMFSTLFTTKPPVGASVVLELFFVVEKVSTSLTLEWMPLVDVRSLNQKTHFTMIHNPEHIFHNNT